MDQRLIVNRWADVVPPVHGADLQRALQHYGGDRGEWLDLSAAVSPYSWWEERGAWPERNPFHHLPEQDPLLQQAMHQYYGQTGLLVAGSMQAIALLPQLFDCACVWVLAPSFAQHAFQWRLQGHEVVEKTATEIRAALSRGEAPDILIWVNPNNPTATMLSNAKLADYAERLQHEYR